MQHTGDQDGSGRAEGRRWTLLVWGPVVVATMASAMAWAWGGSWVLDVVGTPPGHWWWWPAAALGWSVHTDAAHLAVNAAGWWWASSSARRVGLGSGLVAGTALAGFVAGAGAWLFVADGRRLVGLSGALCALCALLAVAGSGKVRWVAAVAAGLFLLPWAGTSWWTHAVAVAVGVAVALGVVARRRPDGPGEGRTVNLMSDEHGTVTRSGEQGSGDGGRR